MSGIIGGTGHDNPDPEKDNTPTPHWLAERMGGIANIKEGEKVIDPCCGDGRFFPYLPKHCSGIGFEIRKDLDWLKSHIDIMPGVDFLDTRSHLYHSPKSFDLAIMNPPFSKCGVWEFMMHLIEYWLIKDWRIITVLPLYILQQNKIRREWYPEHLYDVHVLDIDSFPGRTVNGFICEFRSKLPEGHKSKYLVNDAQLELISD